MYVIGRGRYARETYPESPRGGGVGCLRVGYDQPIEGLELPTTGLALALFPRDTALPTANPLRVTIPGVTPGNTLEVDMRFNIFNVLPDPYDEDFVFLAIAIVTFDGSTAFPGIFQMVMNSIALVSIGNLLDDNGHSLSSLAAVEIPAGATTAVVEVVYFATQNIGVPSKDGPASVTLKASEICASATAQLGPGELVPLFGPPI